MNPPDLSIVVPALNEQHRIGPTLESMARHLDERHISAEVIVVNDGSADSTIEAAARFRKRFLHMKIVSYHPNRGKGFAVRRGMLLATGTARLMADADGSTPIEDLGRLMPLLDAGEADIAVGSIGLDPSTADTGQTRIRAFAGRMGNALIRAIAVPGIRDTQRGFKLFTGAAAGEVFTRCYIDGWGFDVEALAVARRLGYRIVEVPVRYFHHPDSRVGLSAYPTTLAEVVRVRLGLWTGRYRFPKSEGQ